MTKTKEPVLIADGFVFLEAPRWHDGRLWVSDVFGHKVFAVSGDGSREIVCEMHRPTGLGFLPSGGLVIVDAEDRKLRHWLHGKLTEYADLSQHAAGHLNDFAIDANGRIWVGNFGYDYEKGEPVRTTALHLVDTNGAVVEAVDGVEFPNGSTVIDGGRALVIAETWAGRLISFDIAHDGRLTNRQVFADLGHRQPDGICADAEDAIWAGCFNTGEFVRVARGGAVLEVIQLQGAAISCALGGSDGRQLFMTSYDGTVDDIAAKLPRSAIHSIEVSIPAAR